VVSGLSAGSGDGQTRLTKLFNSTKLIGSNSGGSWFFSQLAYSKIFVEMIGSISDQSSVNGAADVYYDKWVFPFINNPRTKRMLLLDDIGGAIGAVIERAFEYIGIGRTWYTLISNVIHGGISWQSFVESIIHIPGDIDSTVSLRSAKSNPWCTDKIWAIAAAIVSPSTNNYDGGFGSFNTQCDKTAHSFTYKVKEEFAAGISVPVTFSTVLGSNSESPLPFIPETSTFTPSYDILERPSTLHPIGKTVRTIIANETVVPGPGMSSNEVSINDAVATSSAFLAQALSIFEELNPYVGTAAWFSPDAWSKLLDLTIRFAAHPSVKPEAAFSKGADLVRPRKDQTCDQWLDEVASNHVMTLSDGGYVDNTGISNIVATAANNSVITVVMNTKCWFNTPSLVDSFYTVSGIFVLSWIA